MVLITSSDAPLTLPTPRTPGYMTTPQSRVTILAPSSTSAPCATVSSSPVNLLSFTPSTKFPTVPVPVVLTFYFPINTISVLPVPNPICTSASLPPRSHSPSPKQPPAPLYPPHSLNLFGVPVNPLLKLQPSPLKNKTNNYVLILLTGSYSP